MHEHQLVRIQDFNGDHHIRWCIDCGLIMEVFGDTFAEMVPEWSKPRLLNRSEEKYIYASDKVLKFPEKRLGKGLKELMTSAPTYNPFKK